MTYTAGQPIQAVDYNTFAQGGSSPDNNVANVNTIWGTGTLDKGWGQSSPVATVTAATDLVTATQWTTLFNRFVTIANQTNTSITAIVNPTAGDTIAVKNNFSTNLSSCFTNRNNAVGVGTTITASGVATEAQLGQLVLLQHTQLHLLTLTLHVISLMLAVESLGQAHVLVGQHHHKYCLVKFINGMWYTKLDNWY
jgi:hypothetical protein